MIRRAILAIAYLNLFLISRPLSAHYLPGVQSGLQGIYQGNGDNTNAIFVSMSRPIYQSKRNLLFADIRLSQNNKTNQGLHFGLAARHQSNNVQYGIYGFYDIFNTTSVLMQYVAGVEVLSHNFRVRMNAYYPYGGNHSSNIGMKGLEEEVEIKIAQYHETFLALKKYNFTDNKINVDGYGISVKYEGKKKSRWNVQTAIGYRYDNLNFAQVSVNFGISIVLDKTEHLCLQKIQPIQRSMFVYGKLSTEQEELSKLQENLLKEKKYSERLKATLKAAGKEVKEEDEEVTALKAQVAKLEEERTGKLNKLQSQIEQATKSLINGQNKLTKTMTSKTKEITDAQTAKHNPLAAKINTLDEKVTPLATGQTNLEKKITTLQNDQGTKHSDLKSHINTKVQTITGKIDTVASAQTANHNSLDGKINELDGKVTPLATGQTNLDNKITALQTDQGTKHGELKDKINKNVQTITGKIDTVASAQTANHNSLDGKINELDGKVTPLATGQTNLEKKITTLQNDQGTKHSDLKSHINTKVQTITGKIDTVASAQTANHDSLGTKINTLDEKVTPLATGQTNLEKKITTLQNDQDTKHSDLKSHINTKVQTITGKIDTVASAQTANHDSLGTKINTLDEKVTPLATGQTNLDNKITALQTDQGTKHGELKRHINTKVQTITGKIDTVASAQSKALQEQITKNTTTVTQGQTNLSAKITNQTKTLNHKLKPLETISDIKTIKAHILHEIQNSVAEANNHAKILVKDIHPKQALDARTLSKVINAAHKFSDAIKSPLKVSHNNMSLLLRLPPNQTEESKKYITENLKYMEDILNMLKSIDRTLPNIPLHSHPKFTTSTQDVQSINDSYDKIMKDFSQLDKSTRLRTINM